MATKISDVPKMRPNVWIQVRRGWEIRKRSFDHTASYQPAARIFETGRWMQMAGTFFEGPRKFPIQRGRGTYRGCFSTGKGADPGLYGSLS